MRSILTRALPQLSESLLHRLNLYALTASAAGVASLALAHPAEAKIVYTPAHIPIVVNGGFTELDLNHDGINDFQFLNITGTQPQLHSTLNVAPAQNLNRVWAGSCSASFKTSRCAVALPKGTIIGPRSPFQKDPASVLMAGYQGASQQSGSYFGGWALRTAYLGLKFVIKGKTHFGWARVQVVARSKGFVATITGYAYETISNKSIIAGKTKGPEQEGVKQLSPTSLAVPTRKAVTLGLLALGSPGPTIWRREEREEYAVARALGGERGTHR
jgi:hypothetical protein